MNIANWLERAGQRVPDQPALMHGDVPVRSYARCADRVARLATSLTRDWGLVPGSHVAIMAKNSPDYIELLFAIWHAGLVAVPINAKLHPKEARWILEDSQSIALFLSADLQKAVCEQLPSGILHCVTIGSEAYEGLFAAEPMTMASRESDDLAWLFYTSGTTGQPKGAMLSHRNLAVMSWAYLSEVDPCKEGDFLFHAAPISHGSGMYALATILARGTNVVAASGGFDAGEVLTFVKAHPGTSLFAAPTMIKQLVASDIELAEGSLRTIIWGGAPMHAEDIKAAVDRFGPHLAQIYGQGESPMTISLLPRQTVAKAVEEGNEATLISAGMINSAVEVCIKGAERRGEVGEILVRGDSVMLGYWNNDSATTKTIRDGWLHTGDVGCLDESGLLHLKDRSKDVIISGGSNIYPREVEEILLKHDGVKEASVIGRPDDEWGELVIAYYVGSANATELDALCLASIARFKRPKAYIRLESLPKNNYGKILKTDLRQHDEQFVENGEQKESKAR